MPDFPRLNYAVNISMIHADKPLRERLRLVAEAGFRAFEFWFPYQFDMDELGRCAREFGLEVALFDLEPDNEHPHGHLAHPDTAALFRRKFDEAVSLATRLRCRVLNVLCGAREPTLTLEHQKQLMAARLREVAPIAESAGVTLCVEGINRVDRPRALISYSRDGFDVVDAVASPNVKYQYDVYHMQIMEGDVIRTMRANIARIGHVQVADPPGRHEPGTGEVNVRNVLGALAATPYRGWVSLEYNPSPGATDPFAWLPPEVRAPAAGPR